MPAWQTTARHSSITSITTEDLPRAAPSHSLTLVGKVAPNG
jgi:hypothetical protein